MLPASGIYFSFSGTPDFLLIFSRFFENLKKNYPPFLGSVEVVNSIFCIHFIQSSHVLWSYLPEQAVRLILRGNWGANGLKIECVAKFKIQIPNIFNCNASTKNVLKT